MTRKRTKLFHEYPNHHLHLPCIHQEEQQKQEEEEKQLIPGLPDHISHLCLSKLHPSFLYSVSSSWRRLIYSPLFPPFLSLYALLTPTACPPSHSSTSTPIQFSSFDPISGSWHSLPPPPDPPLQLVSRHSSFISRNLSIQAVTSSDRLVVVAASTPNLLPALPRPLVFDPLAPAWAYGPSLSVPRRWCAAGALGTSVYMASGIGSRFSTDTARSVEWWDLTDPSGGGNWHPVKPLRDGRFSREAVPAVGWRGRICVVNVAAKEGAVYDAERDEWGEMPQGMVDGWTGPAASLDEEVIYVVDECKGVLRKYDEERDRWEDLLESEKLRGAQQMAGGGGRVCVVCGGNGGEIMVVDVMAEPVKMWIVDPPDGFKVVGVHVLPRMSSSAIGEFKP